MVGCRLPPGSGTSPAMSQRVPWKVWMPTMPPRSEAVTRWPLPLRSLSASAAATPKPPNIPARMSAMGTPTFVGGPPKGPVNLMRPPSPCTIWSKPGRWPSGPPSPKPGIESLNLCLSQTKLLHDARAEVLDEHVGPADERPQLLQVLHSLEVEHHGLLTAVHGEVVGRLLVARLADERRAPPAAVVALPGALDLYHLGASVGQHHGRVGAGQRPGEVDDGCAGERSRAVQLTPTSRGLKGSAPRWTPDLRT